MRFKAIVSKRSGVSLPHPHTRVTVASGVGLEDVSVYDSKGSDQVIAVDSAGKVLTLQANGKDEVKGVSVLGGVLVIVYSRLAHGGGGVLTATNMDSSTAVSTPLNFTPTSVAHHRGALALGGSTVPLTLTVTPQGSVNVSEWQPPQLPYDPLVTSMVALTVLQPSGALLTCHVDSQATFCVVWSESGCQRMPAVDLDNFFPYPACSMDDAVYFVGSRGGRSSALLCTPDADGESIITHREVRLGVGAVSVLGDRVTGVDLLVCAAGRVNGVVIKRGDENEHSLDVSEVNELLDDNGVLGVHSLKAPLSMTELVVKIHPKNRPGEAVLAEVVESRKLTLRKLSELEAFTCDRETAMGLIGITPEAPDALGTMLEYLVENKLTRLIVGCVTNCNVDDDYSTLRQILYWLQGKIDELVTEMPSHVEEKNVNVLSMLKSHMTQYLVIADTLLQVAEGSSCVELQESKAILDCLIRQARHVLWMESHLKAHKPTITCDIEGRRETLRQGLVDLSGRLGEYSQILLNTQGDEEGVRSVSNLLSHLEGATTTLPVGLTTKLDSLGMSTTDRAAMTPPVMCYDILLSHALLGDTNGAVTAEGEVVPGKIFAPLKSAVLCKNDKVSLRVPVGAGWVSGVVEGVNADETFDLRTGDGAVHRSIPLVDACKQGADQVIHKGIQHNLKLSFVFYSLMCVFGLEGLGAGPAGVYARYEAGLPRKWVAFLKSLWAVDFGTAKDKAMHPLHIVGDDDVAGIMQVEEGNGAAVNCLALCARDLSGRAVELTWVESEGGVFSTAQHGCGLYPRVGASVGCLAHIDALVREGYSTQAMEVVRGCKMPILAGYVLGCAIMRRRGVRDVLRFSVAPAEEMAVVGYLNSLKELQKDETAHLSIPLRGADVQKLLIAFHQFCDDHTAMYHAAAQQPTAELHSLITRLSSTLPTPALTVPPPLRPSAPYITAKPPTPHPSHLPAAQTLGIGQ